MSTALPWPEDIQDDWTQETGKGFKWAVVRTRAYHLYRPTWVLPARCLTAQFPATTGRKHVSYLPLFPAS